MLATPRPCCRLPRPAAPRRRAACGFTLVELLVSVAIAAILISIAAPSYVALTNPNRLATQANDILGGLMIARSEAIRLNQRVVFCRSDDGSTCSAATDGWRGWLVFADTDGTDTQRHILIRQCISTFASQANILAQLFHTDQRVLVICRERSSCKIAFGIGIIEIRQGHAAGRASMQSKHADREQDQRIDGMTLRTFHAYQFSAGDHTEE